MVTDLKCLPAALSPVWLDCLVAESPPPAAEEPPTESETAGTDAPVTVVWTGMPATCPGEVMTVVDTDCPLPPPNDGSKPVGGFNTVEWLPVDGYDPPVEGVPPGVCEPVLPPVLVEFF